MLNQPTLFIQGVIDILCTEDVESFVELFSSDAELIMPNALCVGNEAIRTAVTGMYQTYIEISIELEHVFAQDNILWVQWRWSDRKRISGQTNQMDTAIVIEMDGERIKRWREYHAPVLQR